MFIVTSKTKYVFQNSTRGCLQGDDVSIKYVTAPVGVYVNISPFEE